MYGEVIYLKLITRTHYTKGNRFFWFTNKWFKKPKPMKTLEQFKLEQGVSKIDLLQGKGRKYATVNTLSVIVSTECDMARPLFVFHNTEKNLHVICNSNAKYVGSI